MMSTEVTARLILIPLVLLIFDESIAEDTAAGRNKPAEKAVRKTDENPAAEAAPVRRLVQISGKTKLNVRQWPLVGSPDARYIFVEMFDYTCPHCRSLQRGINEAFKRYGDDLAVVTLPVPLAAECNSSVGSTPAHHRDSCEIARLAVAVWRVKPERFHEYHRWLFESEYARTATAARRQAAKLVGDEALRKELAKEISAKYVASHVKLYQKAGGGSVPKLMFPRVTLTGDVGADALCETIERELKTR